MWKRHLKKYRQLSDFFKLPEAQGGTAPGDLLVPFSFEKVPFPQNYFKTILDIYLKVWYYIYKIRDNKGVIKYETTNTIPNITSYKRLSYFRNVNKLLYGSQKNKKEIAKKLLTNNKKYGNIYSR